MSLQVHFDDDANPDALRGRRIAIIGYGNQGHAHALNLRDSGYDVRIGLRPESPSSARARKAGFEVRDIATAADEATVVAMMIPDEAQAACYAEQLQGALRPGDALVFCHGFNIHFEKIVPPEDLDVFMVAPKGPGVAVRSQYEAGHGLPCLVAVHQDHSGRAREFALAYAHGIGCTRAGAMETSFREETECDLFGEQTVLCGGMSHLIAAAFDTLVEAGYDPAMAYFECVHEVKLVADLVHKKGIAGMREAISNTAEFGDLMVGPAIVDEHVRARMREALENVRSGMFADAWMAESAAGAHMLQRQRDAQRETLLEDTGAAIRKSFRLEAGEKDS